MMECFLNNMDVLEYLDSLFYLCIVNTIGRGEF